MGPLLFTIYINDLLSVLKNSVLLFADETKVFTTCTIDRLDPFSTLQYDINSCARWATEWQLPLNVSKCKVLHLGLSNPMLSYTMDGNLLEEVFEEKYLSVIIDKRFEISFTYSVSCQQGKQIAWVA